MYNKIGTKNRFCRSILFFNTHFLVFFYLSKDERSMTLISILIAMAFLVRISYLLKWKYPFLLSPQEFPAVSKHLFKALASVNAKIKVRKKDEKWRKNTIQVMQAGGDYLDDARASGALGIQARVWQPLRLPRVGGISKILVGTKVSGENNLSPPDRNNLPKYGDD